MGVAEIIIALVLIFLVACFCWIIGFVIKLILLPIAVVCVIILLIVCHVIWIYGGLRYGNWNYTVFKDDEAKQWFKELIHHLNPFDPFDLF